jgi:hypothetical protein
MVFCPCGPFTVYRILYGLYAVRSFFVESDYDDLGKSKTRGLVLRAKEKVSDNQTTGGRHGVSQAERDSEGRRIHTCARVIPHWSFCAPEPVTFILPYQVLCSQAGYDTMKIILEILRNC